MTDEERLKRFGLMIDMHFGAKALGFSRVANDVWGRSLKCSMEVLERWRVEQWTSAGWAVRQ